MVSYRGMNLSTLKQHPAVFNRLLGLTPAKFGELVAQVQPLWSKAEAKRLRHPRKIKPGSGRPFKLSLEESVAMLLLYVRSYATHAFLGALFNINDSTVCRYFAKARPVVESVFNLPTKQADLSEATIADLVVDATEQRTERRRYGAGFSGKRQAHTIKTQIVVDRAAAIRHVSASVPGNIHDKKLFDQSMVRLPDNTKGDLGYLGVNIKLPHKASKLHPLTASQRAANRRFSRARLVVEHVIASLKQFRILADRFRGALTHYHTYFLIVCGLRALARA